MAALYNQLIFAVRKGDLDLVKSLIGDDRKEMSMINELFVLACRFGHADIVEYLISKGAYVDAFGGVGLRIAIRNKHSKVVNALIENDANVLASDSEAIRLACEVGDDQIAWDVLHQTVLSANDRGRALRTAARYGNFSVVVLIMSMGNIPYSQHKLAISESSKHNHCETRDYLVARLPKSENNEPDVRTYPRGNTAHIKHID